MDEFSSGHEKPSPAGSDWADNTPDITALRKLLSQIAAEAPRLRDVIFSEDERADIKKASELYEKRVQDMLVETKVHLELYRDSGWKELIYGESHG